MDRPRRVDLIFGFELRAEASLPKSMAPPTRKQKFVKDFHTSGLDQGDERRSLRPLLDLCQKVFEGF